MPICLYMDLHQLRLALLKLSVLVLLGSTWLFSGFVLESRPLEGVTGAGQMDPLSQLVRLPASLQTQLPENIPGVFRPQARVVEPVQMNIVKLPCWDRSGAAEQNVSARWIRLVGRTCQGDYSAEAVSVRNLANGYVGTVFNANATSMTTDFIPLEIGKNEILIRFESEPGVSLETQVTFNR